VRKCKPGAFNHENNFKANNKAMLVANRIFAHLKSIRFIDTYYTQSEENPTPSPNEGL
jgi:hypothetical protein